MRTPNEELVQKGQNIYAVDSDGNERFVAELRSASIHAFMEDDGFYVVKSIPYTNFFYNKYFDDKGNYLSEPTEEQFMLLFMREIEYKFMDSQKLRAAYEDPNRSDDLGEIFDEIHEIRRTRRLTYEIIEDIIRFSTEADVIDEISLASYRKVEKLLRSTGIETDLEIPMLNIYSLNESGKFGRRSHRFCSVRIEKMLCGMLKAMGKDAFKAALYDPIAFHKAIDEYINKVR